MLAYFGTDVDWREGTVRVDMDRVEGVSTEWSDKKGCLSFSKISAPGNGIEKISVDKFLLQIPNVTSLFIDNRVLVGVMVGSSEARQGSKEILEGGDIDKDREETAVRRQQSGGSVGDSLLLAAVRVYDSLELEVTDPKDNQRDVEQEDGKC